MSAKKYSTYNDNNGIIPRVKSDDFCITKLFDPHQQQNETVKVFSSKASVLLFRNALKSLWAPKYFPPKSKATALEIWSTFKADLEKVFNESPWMDDESKKRAIEKLGTIKFDGGYPDEILDKEKMQAYHNNFLAESLEADSFIENQANFIHSIQLYHIIFWFLVGSMRPSVAGT